MRSTIAAARGSRWPFGWDRFAKPSPAEAAAGAPPGGAPPPSTPSALPPAAPAPKRQAITQEEKTRQEALKEASREEERQLRATKEADRAFKDLAKRTKEVADNILSATYSLAKWAGLATLGGGLLGSAGLFGTGELAAYAGAQRRSAQGFGVRMEERQAFDLNYSRFFDPDSVLANIRHAKNSAADRWVFGSMGITGERQKDPAELGVEMAIQAKRIFEQGGQSMDYAKARGLDKIYTEDDLMRLHEMSLQELEDQRKKYYADVRDLRLTQETQRRWQDLSTQLGRAGRTIENVLIDKLVTLTPSLTHLSDSFAKAVKTLLSTDTLKGWIDGLASGIEWLAKYLVSPAFKQNMVDAGDAIGEFVSAVGRAVRIFEGWFGEEDTGWHPKTTIDIPWLKSPDNSAELERENKLIARDEEAVKNSGLLAAIWAEESSSGKDLRTSKKGALGQFQIMPDTARQYGGLKDPNDYNESSKMAAHILADYINQFQSVAKGVAAYNWGPGNVEKDVEVHGDRWREFLPDETKKYLNDVLSKVHSPDVNITITNQTGASVSVTTGAASVQR